MQSMNSKNQVEPLKIDATLQTVPHTRKNQWKAAENVFCSSMGKSDARRRVSLDERGRMDVWQLEAWRSIYHCRDS